MMNERRNKLKVCPVEPLCRFVLRTIYDFNFIVIEYISFSTFVAAYKTGGHDVDVQIAGYVYTIDFSDMTQYRVDEPMRTRKILRSNNVSDRVTGRRLRGVAGLPLDVIGKRDY